MQKDYIYTGCFVSFCELEKVTKPLKLIHLTRLIMEPHITFSYRPESVDESLFGEKIKFTIVSYGRDDENEGLGVELHPNSYELEKMAEKIACPHITLSLSEKGRAVDTGKLKFKPIQHIEMEGVFGGFSSKGEIVTRAK